MSNEAPRGPGGLADRRGFTRVSITESIKLQMIDAPPGSAATFGSTLNMSRGGLEAVVQGAPVQVSANCIVRFLSTTRMKPVMVWGSVMGVEDSPDGRIVRVEFDTPLEYLRLSQPAKKAPPRLRSVLVVDDDRHIRGVLERFLKGAGYAVRLADDGADALKALRNELPDVLLLDIYMPKLNGLQVLDQMQQEGLSPQVVMTISGAADNDAARQSLQKGAHDFLLKPFDLKYLHWAIRLRL